MPSIQIEHIINAGYTTVALLAHGIHDESKMEDFVEYLSLVPDGELFQTFSPQSAAIRRVLKECISRCVVSGRETAAEPTPSPSIKACLSVANVKASRMSSVRTTQVNCCCRLLCHHCRSCACSRRQLKRTILHGSRIPWKSRASEADEQIFLEHRRPRNDRQLLRSLLSEGEAVPNEQPEATINHQAPVEVVLGKSQRLLTIALAMLGSAHLIVLKRFLQLPSPGIRTFGLHPFRRSLMQTAQPGQR